MSELPNMSVEHYGSSAAGG